MTALSAATVVCLCGSFRFATQMQAAREALEAEGVRCLLPLPDVDVARGVRGCFARIDAAEAVLVVDPGGYIGTSVLLDIGYAAARDKPIYLTAAHDDAAVMSLVTGVIAV